MQLWKNQMVGDVLRDFEFPILHFHIVASARHSTALTSKGHSIAKAFARRDSPDSALA